MLNPLMCILKRRIGLERPFRAMFFIATACIMQTSAMATDPGNVVADGQFLLGQPTAPFTEYTTGQTFGGWKVEEGRVRVSVNYFTAPNDHTNTAELTGTGNSVFSQELATVPGKTYTVKFFMAGDWEGFKGDQKLIIEADPLRREIPLSMPGEWSRSNMGWKEISLPFIAKSNITKLRLRSEHQKNSGGVVVADMKVVTKVDPPNALETIPVPTPPDLEKYVSNKDAAIALGKALFWDMQTGSDGKTACATCHWHAGADARTRNTLHPGAPGSAFGPQRDLSHQLAAEAIADFPGVNLDLKASDFPFHRLKDMDRPASDSNPVIFDTKKVVGSQGVVSKRFLNINAGNPVDSGETTVHPIFNIDGTNVRQVTGRNAPTTINAIFFDRSFWDGRANRFFNGVNPFGDLDPDARVLKVVTETITYYEGKKKRSRTVERLEPVRVLIDNGALASQAVGPPNNRVEISWNERTFRELARKMFSLRPLALQSVHENDSVLGQRVDESGRGLSSSHTYPAMIRQAFKPEWWKAESPTADGYTQMEANFSLFWGLAIQMYESTLVSDDTPFDRWRKGDEDALSKTAQRGLDLFLNEGKCINCHGGPEFAGATVSQLRGVLSNDGPIEFMAMAKGTAFYDGGFYNIGVRQTEEDIGVGASHPQFGPLSYSRQSQNGRDIKSTLTVSPDARVAVDGAFKSPTLRNIELTGPYFHNGGQKDLLGVVEFYVRGADFKKTNIEDLDPDVNGISELQGDEEGQQALVEFMKHLTDERVKFRKAPFDHPEIILPNGHTGVEDGVALDNDIVLPATGRDGGDPFMPFEEALNSDY